MVTGVSTTLAEVMIVKWIVVVSQMYQTECPVRVNWFVGSAVMLLAVRLKWRKLSVIGQFRSVVELYCLVRLWCWFANKPLVWGSLMINPKEKALITFVFVLLYRQILAHTSGLPREVPCSDAYSYGKTHVCPVNNTYVLEQLSRTELKNPPGRLPHYR